MDILQLGPWRFTAADFSISDETQRVELEPLLCKLLLFFASNPGRIVSRQELIDAIWQQSFVDDNAINRAISELRKVLQHPTLQQSPIKTHHRKGYSLQLAVEGFNPTSATTEPVSTKPNLKHNVLSRFNLKPYFISIIVIAIVALVVAISYRFLNDEYLNNPEKAKPALTDTAIDTKPFEQNIKITTSHKITWFKGVESRPILSPDKQLLAYTHSLSDGTMRTLVRKATLSVTKQALQEVAIESVDSHFVTHSWQPLTQRLLVQSVAKDGTNCQYLVYDFSDFPQYEIQALSKCSGFTLGNAQVSVDGQWLYRSATTGAMYSSNSLIAENLITGDTQTLLAAPATGLGANMLALSPDGSKLAYIFMPESNKPEIFIYTPTTREHLRLLAAKSSALLLGLDWSADQSTLYLPGYDSILKLDIASKAVTILNLPDDIVVGELSMLSDNQAYTSAMSIGTMSQSTMQIIKVLNPFDEKLRQFTPLNNAEGSVMVAAFSPIVDNRYAFSANWSGSWQLWLHDADKDKQLTELVDASQPIKEISWSNDGRYLAFSKSGNLYLYDLLRQQLIPKLENNDMGQPVWLPDNSGIVFTRIDNNNQNLWQLDLISNELTQLTFGGAYQAIFDASGQMFYHRNNRIIRYVDGRRADIEIISSDESENYMALSLIQNNEQWRYSMLGHIQRRSLSGEVLQQTQLPYQLISIHLNPLKPEELYLTVFVTPELALEFIEWQIETE